jgi:hypothetical protein
MSPQPRKEMTMNTQANQLLKARIAARQEAAMRLSLAQKRAKAASKGGAQ